MKLEHIILSLMKRVINKCDIPKHDSHSQRKFNEFPKITMPYKKTHTLALIISKVWLGQLYAFALSNWVCLWYLKRLLNLNNHALKKGEQKSILTTSTSCAGVDPCRDFTVSSCSFYMSPSDYAPQSLSHPSSCSTSRSS